MYRQWQNRGIGKHSVFAKDDEHIYNFDLR